MEFIKTLQMQNDGKTILRDCLTIVPAIENELYIFQNLNGSWGIITDDGEFVLPPAYSKILRCLNEYVFVEKEVDGTKRQAIFNAKTKTFITDFCYNNFKKLTEPSSKHLLFLTVYESKYGFIYIKDDSIINEITPQFDSIGNYTHSYIRVIMHIDGIKNVGLVNSFAQLVVNPIYKDVSWFTNDIEFFQSGYAKLITMDDQCILMDKDGNISNNSFTNIKLLKNNDDIWFEITENTRVGLADRWLNIIIPPKYKELAFQSNFLVARKYTGYIDLYTKSPFELIESDLDIVCVDFSAKYAVITFKGGDARTYNYSEKSFTPSSSMMLNYVSDETINGIRYCFDKSEETYRIINSDGYINGSFDEPIVPVTSKSSIVSYIVKKGNNTFIIDDKGFLIEFSYPITE